MQPVLENTVCHISSKTIFLYSHNPLNSVNINSLVMVLPATFHALFPHQNARRQCTHTNRKPSIVRMRVSHPRVQCSPQDDDTLWACIPLPHLQGGIPRSGIVKVKYGLSLSLTGPLLSNHSSLETEERMISDLSSYLPCTWWSAHNQIGQWRSAEYWIFQEVKKEKNKRKAHIWDSRNLKNWSISMFLVGNLLM